MYLDKVLESLSSLFLKDTEKEFLDASKFDILSERLSNLFTIERFEYEDYIRLSSRLSSCLLNLCQYLTDDYQLKSLNLKVILFIILDFVAPSFQRIEKPGGNFQFYGQADRPDSG